MKSSGRTYGWPLAASALIEIHFLADARNQSLPRISAAGVVVDAARVLQTVSVIRVTDIRRISGQISGQISDRNEQVGVSLLGVDRPILDGSGPCRHAGEN